VFENTGKPDDMTHTSLSGAVNILKAWDFRCGETSIATSLAVTWGEKILPAITATTVQGDPDAGFVEKARQFAAVATADQLIIPFQATINKLTADFGNWQIPWGEINRFQRISSDIDNK